MLERTPEDFGGANQVSQLIVPAGIGDISWIYSKIKDLKRYNGGREVILSLSGEQPRRGADFIGLLPNVHYGGYVADRTSWGIITQCIPSDWPDHMGYGPLHSTQPMNIAANLHLEMGLKLRDWMPKLPVDYHYELSFTNEYIAEASKALQGLSRPIICAYVSNRDKDTQVEQGWRLWDTEAWVTTLEAMAEAAGASVLLVGAEWDRNKTMDVFNALKCNKAVMVGRPLGSVLCAMRMCSYMISYPSGMGIMADVLNIPGIMLLPTSLHNLEEAYADPVNIATHKYRAWTDPAPGDVLAWFKRFGLKFVNIYKEGVWKG